MKPPKAEEWRVLLLEHSNPEAWLWVPRFLDRVARFASAFETGFDPAIQIRAFQHHFVVDKPQLFGLVGIVKSGEREELRGHLLGTVEDNFGRRLLTVQQAWSDSYFPDRLIPVAARLLGEWGAKTWDTTGEIRFTTRNRAVARLMRRRYRSQEEMVTMSVNVNKFLKTEGGQNGRT